MLVGCAEQGDSSHQLVALLSKVMERSFQPVLQTLVVQAKALVKSLLSKKWEARKSQRPDSGKQRSPLPVCHREEEL